MASSVALWICLVYVIANGISNGKATLECQEEADIVFMIDSSLSIRDNNVLNDAPDNWELMKNFTAKVVEGLPVENGTVRIGVLVFSTTVNAEDIIYLDNNLSKDALVNNIIALKYMGGNTNTSGALRVMAAELFNGTKGDRAGVRNIGVLATDGLSNVDDHLTIPEARQAKANGIRLFTLGISRFADTNELQEISSDPVAFYYLVSEDFQHLTSLQDQLLGGLCRAKPPPATPCADTRGDIAFIVDDSGSIQDNNPENTTGNYNWDLLKLFLVSVVETMDIGFESTRVAVIRFDRDVHVIFHLNKYNKSADIIEQLMDLDYRGGFTNTSGALRTLRTEVFKAKNGDRPDVRNVGIMITDGKSTIDQNKTLPEAALVKKAGIRMYAIGLTNLISEEELTAIASYPTNEHYFNRTKISHVATLVSRLVWGVCHDPCVGQGQETEIDGWGTACQRNPESICGPGSLLEWRAFPGHLLVGHNYARLTHVSSVEDCQAACIQDDLCRSVDYVASNRECSVAYITRHDAPFSFQADPMASYYEWECTESSSTRQMTIPQTSMDSNDQKTKSLEGTLSTDAATSPSSAHNTLLIYLIVLISRTFVRSWE